MSLSNSNAPIDYRIDEVIGSLLAKGVRLWSDNGQLRYKVGKGLLTNGGMEQLRALQSHMTAILRGANGAAVAGVLAEGQSSGFDLAPLAFSQLSHWRMSRLGERCGLRNVASATSLRGKLDLVALQISISEVVHRHDALRTRIVMCNGTPVQAIVKSAECGFDIVDLKNTSDSSQDIEIQRAICELALEPVDVAKGPLFGMRLVRLNQYEHILIVAMEHMISDAFSLNVLSRDLFTGYEQAVSSHPSFPGPMPLQFPDYAAWHTGARNLWIEKHGKYWAEHFKGCQRLRFPADAHIASDVHTGWGVVSLRTGRELKVALLRWCRLNKTTLAMSAFTAYIGLVLRWCNATESVFLYQIDGRGSPELQNTIGYFASVVCLRIDAHRSDSFINLLNQVTEEYCQAYEHADFAYMGAQVSQPEFMRNSCFNWRPQAITNEFIGADDSESRIACFPFPVHYRTLEKLERDTEPMLGLAETDEDIVVSVEFPRDRFSFETMERFGRNFLMFTRALVDNPDRRLKDLLLL